MDAGPAGAVAGAATTSAASSAGAVDASAGAGNGVAGSQRALRMFNMVLFSGALSSMFFGGHVNFWIQVRATSAITCSRVS